MRRRQRVPHPQNVLPYVTTFVDDVPPRIIFTNLIARCFFSVFLWPPRLIFNNPLNSQPPRAPGPTVYRSVRSGRAPATRSSRSFCGQDPTRGRSHISKFHSNKTVPITTIDVDSSSESIRRHFLSVFLRHSRDSFKRTPWYVLSFPRSHRSRKSFLPVPSIVSWSIDGHSKYSDPRLFIIAFAFSESLLRAELSF